MPEVNLIPMMDVLMSVLTFFILTAMALTGQAIPNIDLPGLTQGGKEHQLPEPLQIGLNLEGDILIDSKPVTTDQMIEAMQTYLEKNPEGSVILNADRQLSYSKVVKLLKEISDGGGGRISLAIEHN